MGKIPGGVRWRWDRSESALVIAGLCFLQILGCANNTGQGMKLWLKIEIILMPHNFVLILCTAVSVRGGIIEFSSLLLNLIIQMCFYTNLFLESSFDCRHVKHPVGIELREFILPFQRGKVVLPLHWWFVCCSNTSSVGSWPPPSAY